MTLRLAAWAPGTKEKLLPLARNRYSAVRITAVVAACCDGGNSGHLPVCRGARGFPAPEILGLGNENSSICEDPGSLTNRPGPLRDLVHWTVH